MNENNNNKEKPRLPPGQHLTERFPVLQKGRIPSVDRTKFILEVEGEVEKPMKFTLTQLNQLQDKEIIVHTRGAFAKRLCFKI